MTDGGDKDKTSPVWEIKFEKRAAKELTKIPKKDQQRIAEAVRKLAHNPWPDRVVQLDDYLYRIRVGRYRIIYATLNDELWVVICRVVKRNEATYKNLDQLIDRVLRLADEDK